MKRIILNIIILFLFQNAYSQTRMIDTEVRPLNRAFLYFNEAPQFSSSLNQEKNKITLKFYDVEVLDSAKDLVSTGIISEIFNIEKEDTLITSIMITNPRGYTAIPLPYSNAVMVDIFKWDKISEDEDFYREALLNIMSGLEDNAKLMLGDEKLAEHADANAMLGLMYISENNSSMAFPFIKKAIELNTSIAEINLAYGQFYEFFNDSLTANKYFDKFKKETGKSSFPRFIINLDSSYKSLLMEKPDTNSTDLSSKISESLKKPINFKDSLTSDESFSLTNSFWIYIIAGGIFVFIVIVFMYYKWRQQQLSDAEQKTMGKTRFEEEVKMAKERSEREIRAKAQSRAKQQKANDTKKKPSVLDKKYGSNKPESKGKIKNTEDIPIELKQKKVVPKKNVEEEAKSNQLEEFLETFIPLKKAEEEEITKASKELIEEEDFSDAPDEKSKKSKDPNINLAIHLAEEKQRLKKKQIQDLSKDELDENESLDDLAKKHNVEKGTIETKSTIDKYSKDKQSLDKLSKKFKKDK